MTPASNRTNLSMAAGARLVAVTGQLPALFLLLLLATTLFGWSQEVYAARAGGSVSVGSSRGTIHPGEEVTLAWTALPERADEFELLLVCRSPIPVKIRLTECLDPEQGTFRWHVPNLPCDAARILIRAGMDGEEITWAASLPFRIDWDGREPFVRVTSRGGELWLSKPEHRPCTTWTWGPDSASPGALPGRTEDAAAPPPVHDLAPPDASSNEPIPYRRMAPARSTCGPFAPPSHHKLQLRI